MENLMDSGTVLLTANTETGLRDSSSRSENRRSDCHRSAARMLGFVQDGPQHYLADIGPLGPDKGKGGKFLILPPGFSGNRPDGYFVSQSPTYSVLFAVRGFQVEGKTDQAVALMKQIKIYSLAKALSPPPMEFLNGSGKTIDTLFPDNFHYFELLAKLVDEESRDVFGPLERFQMQSIGIEKGQPFQPDDKIRALLSEAARLGGAIARANTFGPPETYYYSDRKWQGVREGMTYKSTRDDAPQIGTMFTTWRLETLPP